MSGQHIHICRKHAPFFFVLFPDHLEDVYQFGLHLLRSLASGMAARNCRYIGHEYTIVFGAKDYRVIIKAFHLGLLNPYLHIIVINDEMCSGY
jgi:hypothetical protein